MKHEVIEVFRDEPATTCGIKLNKELGKFFRNHPNAKIQFVSQSSFVDKFAGRTTPHKLEEIPCTILTIFYEE